METKVNNQYRHWCVVYSNDNKKRENEYKECVNIHTYIKRRVLEID